MRKIRFGQIGTIAGIGLAIAASGAGCKSAGDEREDDDPLALASETVDDEDDDEDRGRNDTADPMLLQTSSDRGAARPSTRYEEVAPIEVAQASTPPREHVVARGETLYSIARQYYGDPRQWHRIEEANRDRFPSVNRISVGTRLRIP